MERLALCSHTLYNKDLLDKMTEIQRLEKESRYYTPKIFFETLEHWQTTRDNIYSNIHSSLTKLISPEDGYSGWNQIVFIQPTRLKSEFIYTMANVLEKHLLSITHDRKWSEWTSWNMVMSIETFFNAFIFANKESDMAFAFDNNDLTNILYEHIKSQLNYNLFNAGIRYKCGCGQYSILYNHWKTLPDGTRQIVCIDCHQD